MKIGLFTALFHEKKLQELIPYIKNLGIDAIEIYAGHSDNKNHCDPDLLLSDATALKEYKKMLSDNDIMISALNVSGNPIHPNEEIAKKQTLSLKRGIRLAQALEVDRIISFSGCPGGSKEDKTPNWVCCPWPDEYLAMSEYQWNDVLLPFWTEISEYASEYGINRICFEMHPGFCVYNPETLLKCRSVVGNSIGANLDPSHLIWQGITPESAVDTLGEAIYHVHIKDTRINHDVVKKNGVIDTKHYSDLKNRSWVFSTVGYGVDTTAWKRFINALYRVGYDHVLSIEHEDSYMSREEGLEKGVEFLKSVYVKETPGAMWWA